MSRQKIFSASKSTIDARKLLSSINDGYAGQSVYLEKRLQKFGEEHGKTLRLVSVNNSNIYFEDTKSNKYYKADYKKADTKLVFENVTELNIVDQKKSEVFSKACLTLVESISDSIDENGDIKDVSKASKIFKQIEAGYFTPKVIPESGMVKTRDNNSHHITVNESYVPAEIYPSLKLAINESIKNGSIKFASDKIISESITEKNPITELTKRQVAIRRMRTVAESACDKIEFRKVIKGMAAKISNQNIKEAIQIAKACLIEDQEFCTLNKNEIKILVENCLFSEGVFNNKLIRDTSELVWRTNLFINKEDILKEWQTCANKSKVQAFADNVKVLVESSKKSYEDYSSSYDRFITSVVTEDVSSKAIKSQAYLNMLKLLKNVISGSDGDQVVNDTVNDLIIKLESDINNIDDALLYEVEDLLATTSPELIKDTASLADFDKVPEIDPVDDFGGDDVMLGDFDGDMGDDVEGLGGLNDLGGGGDDLGLDVGGDDASLDVGAEEDTDVADAAADDAIPGEEEDLLDLDLAHVIRTAKPISEMTVEDVKTISEKIKKAKSKKPEEVEEAEIKDDEFKNFKNTGSLNESQVLWFKNLMTKASELDKEASESITESYSNLVVGDVVVNEEEDTSGEEIVTDDINDNYDGEISESADIDRNKVLDIIQSIVSAGAPEMPVPVTTEPIVAAIEPEAPISPVIEPEAPIEPIVAGDTEIPAEPLPVSADPANQEDEGEIIADCDIPTGGDEGGEDQTIVDCDMSESATKTNAISEDNDITDPSKQDYNSEKDAKSDTDGKKTNPKLKLSDEDYDGTGDVNTGKDKPNTGLNS